MEKVRPLSTIEYLIRPIGFPGLRSKPATDPDGSFFFSPCVCVCETMDDGERRGETVKDPLLGRSLFSQRVRGSVARRRGRRKEESGIEENPSIAWVFIACVPVVLQREGTVCTLQSLAVLVLDRC